MEENVKMTMLYEIYGKNLTRKQQEIFEEYYLYNLSLREIADNKKISYQAVRDSIKTSEAMLNEFEKNIGMLKLQKNVEKAYEICKNTDDLISKKDELLKLLK